MSEDVGAADPQLLAAVAAADPAAIRSALLAARVLVPVVATGEDSRAAQLAVPRLIGADGRHALPVFSSYDALRSWRAQARPVPMSGAQALAAAVDDGYAAVVLDVAGPTPVTVELRD